MPNRKILSLLTSALLFSSAQATAEMAGLTVTVTNAVATTGTIEVTLFNSSESFMKEVFLQKRGKPDENGTYVAEFAAIIEGDYAIVVVHDENDSQSFDSGFLGFDSERLGYSNNVRPFMGRPDFDDVKMSIGVEDTEIEISLY